MDYEELIEKAKNVYNEGIKLYEEGDFIDAAEKGWCSVELLRKALLVAVGIPYDKAKNLEFGLPIFTRILRSLRKRDLLDAYYKFDSSLHIHGFYEMILSPEEIENLLLELKQWIDEMVEVIRKLSRIDLKSVVGMMEKCLKLKRRILQANVEYHNTLRELNNIIQQAILKIT